MKQRAAMQMALEALEANMQDERVGQWRQMDDACTALREALAQPQGEPVAWMYQFRNEAPVFCTEKRDWADNHSEWKEMPLYATPPSVEAEKEKQNV